MYVNMYLYVYIYIYLCIELTQFSLQSRRLLILTETVVAFIKFQV